MKRMYKMTVSALLVFFLCVAVCFADGKDNRRIKGRTRGSAIKSVFVNEPLPPPFPYPGCEDDAKAARKVIKEIQARFPRARNPASFALAAAFWLYNRAFLPGAPEGPDTISAEIIGYRHGSCGHRSQQLGAILSEVGIEHRLVSIFGIKAPMYGHTAVEALVNKRWLFLDPTLGFVFAEHGGGDVGNYRILSLESALGKGGKPVELVFQRLHEYGPSGSEKLSRMVELFGEDPYNCITDDISVIVSSESPNGAVEKMLEGSGVDSFWKYFADNTALTYSYRTSLRRREPATITVTFDLELLGNEPIGKKDGSSTDLRYTKVGPRFPYAGFFFVGKYLDYHGRWEVLANNKVILEKVSAPGDLVISFFRPNPEKFRRDVQIEVYDETGHEDPVLVLRQDVSAKDARGEFLIPVKAQSLTRCYSITLNPEYFGLEANSLFYDAVRFVPRSK